MSCTFVYQVPLRENYYITPMNRDEFFEFEILEEATSSLPYLVFVLLQDFARAMNFVCLPKRMHSEIVQNSKQT